MVWVHVRSSGVVRLRRALWCRSKGQEPQQGQALEDVTSRAKHVPAAESLARLLPAFATCSRPPSAIRPYMQHAGECTVESRLENVVQASFATYRSLAFNPPPGKFTILAAFVVYDRIRNRFKVISLGSGSKCLPAARLPASGDALHDSHAEVLARRGFVRWLLEEVRREQQGVQSDWLYTSQTFLYALRDDVSVYLYVSTVPCGDASTRLLAAQQDPTMAALKDSFAWPELAAGSVSRGRDNYARLGVLRTKPGRADAPPVLSMSCSDKIARWNVLGVQGALASAFLSKPIYIDTVIIGEVESELRDVVREDCQRAFYGRLTGVSDLPQDFCLNRTKVFFTDIPFVHSRSVLTESPSSSNDSVCWVADSSVGHEILINGIRRGISPKHRASGRFKPALSKASLFALYMEISSEMGYTSDPARTYSEEKQRQTRYKAAKDALLCPQGPFSGWLGCIGMERFNAEGHLVSDTGYV